MPTCCVCGTTKGPTWHYYLGQAPPAAVCDLCWPQWLEENELGDGDDLPDGEDDDAGAECHESPRTEATYRIGD